ncbi:MAG: heavy-metal-associated domain-containing protein [Tetrasphaera sp.]|jgi:copper chaperone|nr:heavy-metal-associated domain-containing protein [Tetrasphaera sp.]
MESQVFHATGLTCGHCGNAVIDELSALDGVHEVGVDVHAGGESVITVTGDRAVTTEEVAAALEEAGGYALR